MIYGRNVYDKAINDLIKQNDEVRKVSTGQGDDYKTWCLSSYPFFKDNYKDEIILDELITKKKTVLSPWKT